MRRIVVALAMLLSLTGCGLQPLYSGGSKSAVAQGLAGIAVEPIEGRAGWLLRNAIVDTIPDGDGPATYRLVIALDDRIEGLGVRPDDATTRERRSLRARYQLVRTADGVTLLDATSGTDAGIDVVSSEYATIAGEDTALENMTRRLATQIITRVGLVLRQQPE